MLCEGRIGLVAECGRNYFLYAGFSCRVSEQSGIHPVSGDDSQSILRWHWSVLAEKVRDGEGAIASTRGACAPQTLPVAAAFDVQLSKRFLQRRLNGGHLFRTMIFLHRRLGALDRCLGRSKVDLLGLQRHVR